MQPGTSIAAMRRAPGRTEEASASYRHAIALDPGLAEAHHNLGTVLLETGQFEEALKAVAARPLRTPTTPTPMRTPAMH